MIDHKMLKEKLSAIGYDGTRPTDAKIVEALLAVTVTLESYQLSEEQQDTVLDLLTLAGQDKLSHLPDIQEDSWENFNYGNVKIGDFVRVKRDAYDSDSGKVDNGLVGILTYMSHGRCSVKYIGLSSGKVALHPMDNLESLKSGVK